MKAIGNRVCVSSATTGTGTLTLGTAIPGFQSFADASIADGTEVSYVIEEGATWEIGTGVFTSPSTLTRVVQESSNSDALVNLAGASRVFLSLNKADLASILTNTNIWDVLTNTTLTDGPTITLDLATTVNGTVTLAGNRTLANPTNATHIGQSGFIEVIQDATGSRTLTYGSNWYFPNSTAPVLSTDANTVDILCYLVLSPTRIVVSLMPNIGQ